MVNRNYVHFPLLKKKMHVEVIKCSKCKTGNPKILQEKTLSVPHLRNESKIHKQYTDL